MPEDALAEEGVPDVSRMYPLVGIDDLSLD
jgi:hypothetical protein